MPLKWHIIFFSRFSQFGSTAEETRRRATTLRAELPRSAGVLPAGAQASAPAFGSTAVEHAAAGRRPASRLGRLCADCSGNSLAAQSGKALTAAHAAALTNLANALRM